MIEPSQSNLQSAYSEETSKQLYVSRPAKIVSYDRETQTAIVEIMITSIDHDGKVIEMPPLADVPVKQMSFGDFCVTVEPIKGDEGIVCFSDRCIDGWWESGEKSEPLEYRFHDLSDAFFDGGYHSKPNAVKTIPNCLNISKKDGSAYIRLMSDGSININGTKLSVDCPATFGSTVDAKGIISSKADVKAGAVSLLTHTHKGVQSGNSSTLPPT